MIPTKVVDKAMLGGWKNPLATYSPGELGCRMIALDPSFWKALGKTLGWGTLEEFEEGVGSIHSLEDGQQTWQGAAHEFYDLILTKQDTKPFWDELLANVEDHETN